MKITLIKPRSIRGVWQKPQTEHDVSAECAASLIKGGFAAKAKANKFDPKPSTEK